MRRRTFLKGAGIATAGVLTAGFAVYTQLPDIPKRPEPGMQDALGWISHRDGAYELTIPRIEMGQNIATALKQIACEELGVGLDAVTIKLHETRELAPVRATVGSESVMAFGVPLAQACASLRDALANGQSEGTVEVTERPFGQLRAFSGGGTHVGRAVPLEQAEDLVRGLPVFAGDIRLDGMVYGRVLFPPSAPELACRIEAFDRPAAEAERGFIALVEDDLLTLGVNQGLGIVAKTPGALDRIEAALALRWSAPSPYQQDDLETAIHPDRLEDGTASVKTMAEVGETVTTEADVDVRIVTPVAAHAPIEPRVAVADYGTYGLTMDVGHQDAFFIHDKLAKRLRLPADRVNVRSHRVGGAFGGKTICTVEMEAAVLSRAVRRPAKVQWTRAQEFRQSFYRPPTHHHIRAMVEDGQIGSWDHRFVSSHVLFTNAVAPNWMQSATNVIIGDPGVARGAELSYNANHQLTRYGLQRLPIFTGPWRGLGAGPNLLAIETAIDACASAASIDPVAFRLSNLNDARLRRSVERVAELSNWRGPVARNEGGQRSGRGVACGIYKEMSYAATVADVEVSPDGRVRVTHLYCTHDCGTVINPDQVRAQCEGNLVWGLGFVFNEDLSLVDGQIAAVDFVDGPIPTMSQVPPMSIDLIDEGESPSGAGETVIVSAMGAIANAIRAATGVPIERYPVDRSTLAA